MSSSAIRECTTLRPSTAISRPATNVHTGLPSSSCAISAVKTATPMPASADVNRHPNELMLNALMPSPIVSLPSGGCTQEPVSHSLSSQYRSSPESILHSLGLASVTWMHPALA